ncbi:hypothetical protein LX15_006249 [Streptoalloteichus tenebrarius]|uniref:DUF202 domain-containing protein n=1 Tax=Streptoalloteichus tenebrarius (strain ATCC 17920 / DSM 40477 / JCM 4838 / CBS 697.72 / NBRC 16177 / NCIMB 11028 / NRRL B-12390 / A12253. 1 / ISP 5477) TaxID=1933 RepID=A0ABT1I441_STRSD|nr:hypothetical protein [Streptoalloteichus tenebrarius]MCP2262509.1 hypothetical protein [Streptoalloteichus tenebrarius]BFE99105.1 hypothetical protein GCM10020241_07810 [Streptoalloteichus tenebrarius]
MWNFGDPTVSGLEPVRVALLTIGTTAFAVLLISYFAIRVVLGGKIDRQHPARYVPLTALGIAVTSFACAILTSLIGGIFQ